MDVSLETEQSSPNVPEPEEEEEELDLEDEDGQEDGSEAVRSGAGGADDDAEDDLEEEAEEEEEEEEEEESEGGQAGGGENIEGDQGDLYESARYARRAPQFSTRSGHSAHRRDYSSTTRSVHTMHPGLGNNHLQPVVSAHIAVACFYSSDSSDAHSTPGASTQPRKRRTAPRPRSALVAWPGSRSRASRKQSSATLFNSGSLAERHTAASWSSRARQATMEGACAYGSTGCASGPKRALVVQRALASENSARRCASRVKASGSAGGGRRIVSGRSSQRGRGHGGNEPAGVLDGAIVPETARA